MSNDGNYYNDEPINRQGRRRAQNPNDIEYQPQEPYYEAEPAPQPQYRQAPPEYVQQGNYNHTPVQQQNPKSNKTGLAIASLVLGIIAILFSWIPGAGVFFIFLAVIALILGITSLAIKWGGKGMAITGVVLAVLAGIIGISSQVIVSNAFKKAADDLPSSTAQDKNSQAENKEEASRSDTIERKQKETGTVKLQVESEGPVTISWGKISNRNQANSLGGKWEQDIEIDKKQFFTVTVMPDFMNGGTDGSNMSCSIVYDNKELAQESGNSTVTCSSGLGGVR